MADDALDLQPDVAPAGDEWHAGRTAASARHILMCSLGGEGVYFRSDVKGSFKHTVIFSSTRAFAPGVRLNHLSLIGFMMFLLH